MTPGLERVLRAEVVEQPALGDPGGARGGIHRRRPLAVFDEDRLERVEHALSGARGTAHALDRIECRPARIRHICYYTGWTVYKSMTDS